VCPPGLRGGHADVALGPPALVSSPPLPLCSHPFPSTLPLSFLCASNRRYTYQSVGALGVVELTAPGRAVCVNAGLERLGFGMRVRRNYAVHSTLDVKHSEAWNREVLRPLVAADPRVARPIAEVR